MRYRSTRWGVCLEVVVWKLSYAMGSTLHLCEIEEGIGHGDGSAADGIDDQPADVSAVIGVAVVLDPAGTWSMAIGQPRNNLEISSRLGMDGWSEGLGTRDG
jgi:hypothetical protein